MRYKHFDIILILHASFLTFGLPEVAMPNFSLKYFHR